MDNTNELTKSIKDIITVSNNTSWFRDDPHYWATASLPFAYAVACVEVVSKMSEKAGAIYQQIIEAWGNPGLKAIHEVIISEVPDSELEKIKQAFLHPEKEFLPDPNRPFRELEETFNGLEIDQDIFEDVNNDNEQLSLEDRKDVQKFAELICLIFEFILVGFNRESDIEKDRFRVIPKEKPPWLILAVMIRTSLESYNITLERLRNVYNLRKYKGQIIDFHKVLTEQPMSRWHRRMIAGSKVVKLKLKNDRVITEAARHWYNCRIVYPSINKYCDAFENCHLDPKNISKQIRPCDDALGYIKRLPRKEKTTS